MVDVADEVERVAVGDPVYALTEFDRDGVAAAYAAVPASLLAPKPSTLDHLQSAAVPLPALSAWQGLFDHGRSMRGNGPSSPAPPGAWGSSRPSLRAGAVPTLSASPRRTASKPPATSALTRSSTAAELAWRTSARSTFPLSDARAAFERSLARGKRGKVVLRVSGL